MAYRYIADYEGNFNTPTCKPVSRGVSGASQGYDAALKAEYAQRGDIGGRKWDDLPRAAKQVYSELSDLRKQQASGQISTDDYSKQSQQLRERWHEALEPGSAARRAAEKYDCEVIKEQGFYDNQDQWHRLSEPEKQMERDWYELKKLGRTEQISREDYARQAQALMDRGREAGRQAHAAAEAARQNAASDPSAIEARIRELEQGIQRDYYDERDQEDAERVDPEVIFGPGNFIRQASRAIEALLGGPARNDPRVAELQRLREQLKKLKRPTGNL